jgi:hypothetical protein
MTAVIPDAISIDIAFRSLGTAKTLEQVMADPALKRILLNRARLHMRRRAKFDPKRMQANDND